MSGPWRPIPHQASTRVGVAARKHVGQAHELDQGEELGRRAATEPDPAAVATRGELKARQRVDGDSVDPDAPHVADRDLGVARTKQTADPVAEARKVLARDRALDPERGRAWSQGHQRVDGCDGKLIGTAEPRPERVRRMWTAGVLAAAVWVTNL